MEGGPEGGRKTADTVATGDAGPEAAPRGALFVHCEILYHVKDRVGRAKLLRIITFVATIEVDSAPLLLQFQSIDPGALSPPPLGEGDPDCEAEARKQPGGWEGGLWRPDVDPLPARRPGPPPEGGERGNGTPAP